MGRRRRIDGMLKAGASGPEGPVQASRPDGFFVPSEEAPHERSFLQWPVSRQIYHDAAVLQAAQQAVAALANAIAQFEPVVILATASQHPSVGRLVSQAVEIWDIPTDDLWCRESGPLFVVDGAGRRAIRRLQFNGRGRRKAFEQDARIARAVATHLDVPALPSELVGEASAVLQDGHGLLVTHESTWLGETRNPGHSRDAIEALLKQAYGAQAVLWAPGVWGEDTRDFPVSAIARLTGRGKAVLGLADRLDRRDLFDRAGLQTRSILQSAGIETLQLPAAQSAQASYIGYVLCNGAVVVPQFGEPADHAAQEALQDLYPARQIMGLDATAFAALGGSLHTAVREMPAARPLMSAV